MKESIFDVYVVVVNFVHVVIKEKNDWDCLFHRRVSSVFRQLLSFLYNFNGHRGLDAVSYVLSEDEIKFNLLSVLASGIPGVI